MEIEKSLRKFYRHYRVKFLTLLKEKTFNNRVDYMHFKRGSEDLVIVFSGFGGEVPHYNYVTSLIDSPRDLLFIKDTFGYKGSYYLCENGNFEPEAIVSQLIDKIAGCGGYKHLFTVGSSKGGTAAIYYGLKHKATAVYAGACQYYIGTYLKVDTHKRILEAMLGKNYSQKDVCVLDSILPDMIRKSSDSQTKINLLYSAHEHTYDEHIKYLLHDLSETNILYFVCEEHFTEHSEVFKTFIPYIRRHLVEN